MGKVDLEKWRRSTSRNGQSQSPIAVEYYRILQQKITHKIIWGRKCAPEDVGGNYGYEELALIHGETGLMVGNKILLSNQNSNSYNKST